MTANSRKTDRKPACVLEGAAGAEKSRIDDDAVAKAVTVESGAAGATSVLPGPPIPPERQAKVKRDQRMVGGNEIREHMEVVGSDNEHVGTVDRCEGSDRIKLTKNDAEGRHHYIPLAWVNRVDERVHLSHTGAEARLNWS